MNKADIEAELEQLETDIAALEGARSGMSETAFQMAMEPLQKRKAELEAALQAFSSGTTYRADVSGGGAAAQGPGATAVGAGGVNAGGGEVGGSIITGKVKSGGDFAGRDLNKGVSGETVAAIMAQAQERVTAAPQLSAADKAEYETLLAELRAALEEAEEKDPAAAEETATAAGELVTATTTAAPSEEEAAAAGRRLKRAAENVAAVTPTVLLIAGQILGFAGRFA